MTNATREQADECWALAGEFWAVSFPNDGPPWVKAGFMAQVFRVNLRQRGLRLPPQLNVAVR